MTRFEHEGEQFAVLSFDQLAAALPGGLSEAEAMVALLVVAGRSNRDIARARGVTERTVANQLSSLYRKLGIRSRGELIAGWTASAWKPPRSR